MDVGFGGKVSVIKAIETAAIEENVVGEVLSREPSFRFMLQTLHSMCVFQLNIAFTIMRVVAWGIFF